MLWGNGTQRLEAGLWEEASCPRRWVLVSVFRRWWAGRGNAKGRRERVKAHVVCFERAFRRSPGGSPSRMFSWLNGFWNWDFPTKSHHSERAELERQLLSFSSSLCASVCVASWWGIGQPRYWSHTQFPGARIILQVSKAFKEDQIFP